MPGGSPPDPSPSTDSHLAAAVGILSMAMSSREVIVPLNALPAPRDTLARPMRDLRISVMDRCNFRCPYCMPRETYHERYRFLGSHERLSFDEIVRLARLFVQLGVRKLRLTGGEPLLRANLPDLVGDLTTIPGVEDVALTTNGVLLARYAGELKAAGLKRVTVSLDSLDPGVFARMSGGFGGVDEVLAGIEQARRAELTPVKINAVVQRGVNDHTVLELVERFRGTGVIVRFIEYMDVGNRNHWRSELVVPSKELAEHIGRRWPLGALYSCLFATHGTSLRDALRGGASDDALLELIRGVWLKRSDRYSELRASRRPAPHEQRKVEMFYIGG